MRQPNRAYCVVCRSPKKEVDGGGLCAKCRDGLVAAEQRKTATRKKGSPR